MFKLDDQARVFGITAVENLFLTEYLPYADGEQIKVYLSALYHSQRGDHDFGVKEMAAELNLEESQVEAALRYWERRRLVERTQDKPPRYVLHHLGQRMLTGQDGFTGDRGFIEFSEAVHAQFKERRKLRPNDTALAYEWVQDLGLPQEVVLMILNHAADTRGINFSFKTTQPLAVLMKEEGVLTPEEAEQYLSHTKRTHFGARSVLQKFNIRRLPTEPELALYRRWTMEWGFDQEAILAACDETVSANNPSFSYLNSILERLKKQGSQTKVKDTLRQEEKNIAQVKTLLDTLGIYQVNPHSLQSAYLQLRDAFDSGMILLAAKSVKARGGTFEHLEPKLIAWKNLGLKDENDVLRHLKRLKAFETLLHKVYQQAGHEGRVGEPELMRVDEWIKQGHSEELILEASLQAAGSKAPLNYINKVLATWQKAGIHTAKEAQKQPAPARGRRKLAFQDYDQAQPGQDAGVGPDLLKEVRELFGQ